MAAYTGREHSRVHGVYTAVYTAVYVRGHVRGRACGTVVYTALYMCNLHDGVHGRVQAVSRTPHGRVDDRVTRPCMGRVH